MGQFKPMVKMYTTEPSVELKLKKGGHVSMKGKAKDGHKMMDGGVMTGLSAAPAPTRMQMGQGTLPARAPARPSLAMRRKMARPMMKEGGESKAEHASEMKRLGKVEKEIKSHADKPASKAHKGLKAGGYASTKMHTATPDHVKGPTGEVKEGKPGGYATGGAIPSETRRGTPATTIVDQAKKDKAHGTGGVRMGNAGGFKKGGKAYAKGGGVENNISTSKPGVTNTTTGEVKEANAGGYKKGGALKKHYATGGLVDSGKPVAYPKHPVSKPVANNLQSGTFKKGGKVKYDTGGKVDVSKPVADPEATAAKASRDLEDALNPISMIKELGGKLMDKIRGKGSVTETKESVTMTPPRARR